MFEFLKEKLKNWVKKGEEEKKDMAKILDDLNDEIT